MKKWEKVRVYVLVIKYMQKIHLNQNKYYIKQFI